MKTPLILLAAAALAGCQAAAVQPDKVEAPGFPPEDVVRPFGEVVCWRVVVPGVPATEKAWPAMCVPTAAVQACIETADRFHCPEGPARRNLMSAGF